MPSQENKRPFRAVIVGGGLVGLVAAHVFSQAGIDFVILEKHENCNPWIGSLLSFWPQTFRVLSQLGLMPTIWPILDPVNELVTFAAEDAQVRIVERPETVLKNHGYGIWVAHRPMLVDALYGSLPDDVKNRILFRKRVVDVDVREDGVSVSCADGSVEEGSIVIGADGVRSQIRHCMQNLAVGRKPSEKEPELPYTTTFRCLFGNIPVLDGLKPNMKYDGTHDRLSTQIITGNERSWFAVYEAIDEPGSKHHRYTEEDKQQVLDKYADLYMAPGWKLRDVVEQRKGPVGLIDLEEGLIDQWYWKRVILVGDAVRKLEPHAGLGFNAGVSDVVVLANGLRRILQSGKTPSMPDLAQLFKSYQDDRMADMHTIVDISMKAARLVAWVDWKSKTVAKYGLPYLPLNRWSVEHNVSPMVARMPVLDWLEEKDPQPPAAVPWKNHGNKNQGDETVAQAAPVSPEAQKAFGMPLLTATILFGTIAVGIRSRELLG